MKARRSKEQQQIISILQKDGIENVDFELVQWLDDVCTMHDFYQEQLLKKANE